MTPRLQAGADPSESAALVAARLAREALAAIRSGAEALEGGRSAEARSLLHAAAELVVRIHAILHESSEGSVGQACRTVCYRLNDAALLRDPAAARDAERACAPIAEALDAALRLGPARPEGGGA